MLERLRELAGTYIPPEPRTSRGEPLVVEVPEPRRLSAELTEPERVEWLARAYRAVLERRYGLKSSYMRRSQLDNHEHYARLVWLSGELLRESVPPLSWVIFSFDLWRLSSIGAQGKRPPPTRWVWSRKRWREQRERYEESRYSEVELRTPPEAAQLYADWRCLWLELVQRAPNSRAGVVEIVDRWFPGDSWEARLSRARSQVWEYQARVDNEVGAGGWPVF